MNRLMLVALVVAAGTGAAVAQGARDEPDLAMYARIREEGLSQSQVMDFAFELMDRIGARLSGSPNLDRAVSWAVDRLTQVGLDDVRRDRWGEFGMAWRQRNTWVTLDEPDRASLPATAVPWSPPTRGPVTADVVYVRGFTDDQGFAPLRGTLRGKVVLMGRAPGVPEVTPLERPLFERLTEEQLASWHSLRPRLRPLTMGRANEPFRTRRSTSAWDASSQMRVFERC